MSSSFLATCSGSFTAVLAGALTSSFGEPFLAVSRSITLGLGVRSGWVAAGEAIFGPEFLVGVIVFAVPLVGLGVLCLFMMIS